MTGIHDRPHALTFLALTLCVATAAGVTCNTTRINCCFCRRLNAWCPSACFVRLNQCPTKQSAETFVGILNRAFSKIATGEGVVTTNRQKTVLMTSSRPQMRIIQTLAEVVDQLSEMVNNNPDIFLAGLSVTKSIVGGNDCWIAANECRKQGIIAACESCVDNCDVWQPIVSTVTTTTTQIIMRTSVGYVCQAELTLGTVMEVSQVISHHVCKNNVFWLKQNAKPKLLPGTDINPREI